jgi:hypothetical protein
MSDFLKPLCLTGGVSSWGIPWSMGKNTTGN